MKWKRQSNKYEKKHKPNTKREVPSEKVQTFVARTMRTQPPKPMCQSRPANESEIFSFLLHLHRNFYSRSFF